jgi:hypothetical protein
MPLEVKCQEYNSYAGKFAGHKYKKVGQQRVAEALSCERPVHRAARFSHRTIRPPTFPLIVRAEKE